MTTTAWSRKCAKSSTVKETVEIHAVDNTRTTCPDADARLTVR